MTDRYAVIGNPIAHSRSPAIHALFAQQTGQDLRYEALLAPMEAFEATVRSFVAEGGRGMNVTVPFKEQAFALAVQRSARAMAAGAANTLSVGPQGLMADNTDGIGLVRDLESRQRLPLWGRTVLLLGAGGAAAGVIAPLLEAGVPRILIVNRTASRAQALAARFADPRVAAGHYDALDPTELRDALLLNATSAGLSAARLPLQDAVFRAAAFAYDMVYAAEPTPFLRQALAQGCAAGVDGLGMLVEQAAESFRIWRGVLPDTEPVHRLLRKDLSRK